ncbi:MAG: carbohydrate-binding domain-containing protein [Nocardioidaceae bacterium]
MRPLNVRRRVTALASAGVITAALLAGCGSAVASDSGGSTTTGSQVAASTGSPTTVEEALAADVDVEAGDTSYDESDVVDVSLDGDTASSDSDAVSVDGDTVTITAAGTYRLSGTLDGQVVVNSTGDGVVRLVLDDADITSSSSAAVAVTDAESVVVVLADGSSNSLADASSYDDTSEDAPTGALWSTADLTIGGSGSLTVTGNTNDGIVVKDGLVISGGTIEVTAVDDGIRGKDYLAITGGDVTVDATGDAVKSDNETDDGTGFVLVSGGTVTVTSQDDGIKGSQQVLVTGGTITVAESMEAMEGSTVIIDGGTIELHAADDALNVSGGSTSSDTSAQGGGGGDMSADTALQLWINGGDLTVWSSGDGLDSNGYATITGGTITVNGPTTDGNGALDVNGTLEISGGTLVALGSAGMAEAPETDSEQAWLAATLDSTGAAGSTITVTDSDGTVVLEHVADKEFASVVFSSADLESGATYTVSVDGTEVATVTNGEAPAGGMGHPMGG